MKKFKVHAIRIGYGCSDFVVEADDETDAQIKAQDILGDQDYSEHNAEHEVDFIEEVEE